MQSIVQRDLLADELEALVRTGHYSTPEEAIRHAIEVLLTANPPLRRSVALELFRLGKVTLSRAAEIAGVDVETFKQYLADAGEIVEVDETVEEIMVGTQWIRQVRSNDQ